jgi:hypothetical protein
MADDTPPAGSTGNPILDANGVQPLGATAPPGATVATNNGDAGGLLQNLTQPAPQQPQTPLGATEGKTDEQIRDDLQGANFQTRVAQGKMLGGEVSYGPSGAGGGGDDYKYDPQQMEAIIKEATEIRTGLSTAATNLRPMQAVKAPAPDVDSSEMQAKATRDAGDAHVKRIWEAHDELTKIIDAFNASKAQYIKQEQITMEQWDKLSKGMQA